MNVTVTHMEGRAPVTVLQIEGDVDGSNYQQLVAKGQEITSAGAHNLILDLGGVSYMSSAGLVALHSITQMARGLPPPDPEAGWEAFRSVSRDQDQGKQSNVKLLNPQPRVRKVLDVAGFSRFYDIFTDLEAAVASF